MGWNFSVVDMKRRRGGERWCRAGRGAFLCRRTHRNVGHEHVNFYISSELRMLSLRSETSHRKTGPRTSHALRRPFCFLPFVRQSERGRTLLYYGFTCWSEEVMGDKNETQRRFWSVPPSRLRSRHKTSSFNCWVSFVVSQFFSLYIHPSLSRQHWTDLRNWWSSSIWVLTMPVPPLNHSIHEKSTKCICSFKPMVFFLQLCFRCCGCRYWFILSLSKRDNGGTEIITSKS